MKVNVKKRVVESVRLHNKNMLLKCVRTLVVHIHLSVRRASQKIQTVSFKELERRQQIKTQESANPLFIYDLRIFSYI